MRVKVYSFGSEYVIGRLIKFDDESLLPDADETFFWFRIAYRGVCEHWSSK